MMFSSEKGFRLPGIAGQVAVVTGAAQGIGRAIALLLADQGAQVVAVDLAPEESWAHQDGIDYRRCDVGDPEKVDAVVTEIEARWGTVTILVNNAGVLRQLRTVDTDLASWNLMLSVNLTGAFLTSVRVIPGMVAAGGGRVINIGSSAGKQGGGQGLTAYAASKAGVLSLTKSLAKEYASTGVTVNAIAPAAIETEMIRDLAGFTGGDSLPVGRLGQPDEVAAAVAYLSSSAASFITGEILDVNGGMIID